MVERDAQLSAGPEHAGDLRQSTFKPVERAAHGEVGDGRAHRHPRDVGAQHLHPLVGVARGAHQLARGLDGEDLVPEVPQLAGELACATGQVEGQPPRRRQQLEQRGLCHPSGHSRRSSPTTGDSGRSATRRTASSTPGMKLVRSVVTWRRVSVWATPPRTTSWSATTPGRRTEWIGTSPSISSAVRAAVPDGLSSLAGGWYSMISAPSMCRDASAAKRIISTAPIAKLGATKTLAEAPLANERSCPRSKPVVPMTTCTPASSASRALPSAWSG